MLPFALMKMKCHGGIIRIVDDLYGEVSWIASPCGELMTLVSSTHGLARSSVRQSCLRQYWYWSYENENTQEFKIKIQNAYCHYHYIYTTKYKDWGYEQTRGKNTHQGLWYLKKLLWINAYLRSKAVDSVVLSCWPIIWSNDLCFMN